MAQLMDLVMSISKEESRLRSKEQMGGKGLFQPFSSTNSGSRRIMQESQLEQALQLLNPEVPIIGTGYENRFGDESSSIIRAESDFEIIDKISKFQSRPNDCYYLITRDLRTGRFGLIERIPYYHTTETYGYLYDYDNTVLDKLDIGYEVKEGELLRSSKSYDKYQNRCDGINMWCTYINMDATMEDGILMTKSAAKKLASPLLKRVQVTLNDNDILLNIMGEGKSFPDIGEEIKNGILVAVRREKIEESLYMQSVDRLSQLMISDEKYTVSGRVIDINIFSNSPDTLESRYSNKQVLQYYREHQRVCKEIVDCISKIRSMYGNIHMTHELEELWFNCKRELEGTLFMKEKSYVGTLIEFFVLEESIPLEGDKCTNRYGGKGIIAKIIPDEQMPILDNGKRIEVCFNGFTCTNRLNWGQLGEVSLTFMGSRILEYIENSKMHTYEAIDMIYRYIKHVSEEEAEDFYAMLYNETTTEEDREWYLSQMIDDGYIMLSNKPITESIDIDKLNAIYKEFPFISQYSVMTPIVDSTGNIRYIPGMRKITAGQMYIYRLKQYGEEKFSVTSLSSTNIKNENTRSKAAKVHKSPYTDTPIRFGEMESGDLQHMGALHVVQTLMVHSVSPQGRRRMIKAITGDPYHVNIKLDSNSKNRNVEILNTYLKTMGLALEFTKKRKKLTKVFKRRIFTYEEPKRMTKIFTKVSPIILENYDVEKEYNRRLAEKAENDKHIFKKVIFQRLKKGDK